MRILSFVACVIAVLAGASPAVGQDSCPPLSLITSVDMQIGSDGRIYVPAAINGAKKSMLVDTGGFFTEITQPVSEALKLSPRHTRLEIVGVAGDETGLAVRAGFTLGKLHSDSMDFMVMPGNHSFAPDVTDAAGLLAPNLLRVYDLDLDLDRRKLTLISPKHCDGKVVYWRAGSVAVIPVRINLDGHILVPVELDGERMTAVLDTGATTSVLNLDTARKDFGLEPGSNDAPLNASLVNGEIKVYSHRFKTLALEGVAVANPKLTLMPDLMRGKLYNPHNKLEGDTRISNSVIETGLGDMILGMDILRHLHMYIAYKEQKLYVSPASGGPPATNPSTPDPRVWISRAAWRQSRPTAALGVMHAQ
jgi:predicted aspartyl protease